MTDQEIVDGLINRDEKITDWFFNIKYRPLFINVIKLIFDYQVDYDECISELYYHLMKNDAAVLRHFEGRSTFQSNGITISASQVNKIMRISESFR